MHMLGDLWLKTPLTAQPVGSHETGHQYPGQLSMSFLSGAGASIVGRPVNLLALRYRYSVNLTESLHSLF